MPQGGNSAPSTQPLVGALSAPGDPRPASSGWGASAGPSWRSPGRTGPVCGRPSVGPITLIRPSTWEGVITEMAKETAKRLEEVETELGELGEAIQKALDRTFQEEYEVKDVAIDSEGLILVSVALLEDADED